MVEDGQLHALASTQSDILRLLKFNQEMGTEDLARGLFITAGAVRHHLALLTRAGYVVYRQEAERRGRPRFIYRLTEEGYSLFPTAYRELTLALVKATRDEAPGLLEKVLHETVEERFNRTTLPPGAGGRERAAAIAELLEDEGYMPSVAECSPAELTLHHCPILDAATAAPALCAAELDYLRRVTGCEVERIEWRLKGADLCRYRLSKPECGQ
ncbi:MAG: transcriptional regulator [Dehalococcoidia bacterium]|nr:transcriptional regulator [Dehalococcoidia bacterium]